MGKKIVLVVEKQVERSDPQCVLRVVTLEFLVNLQHVQQIRKSSVSETDLFLS